MTLLLGAIGTYIMIRINVTWEGFKKLLQTGDYSLTAKKDKKAAGVISGFYWPLVTAVYLLWSSVSNSWGISWIIWPIAALLYPVILVAEKAIRNKH